MPIHLHLDYDLLYYHQASVLQVPLKQQKYQSGHQIGIKCDIVLFSHLHSTGLVVLDEGSWGVGFATAEINNKLLLKRYILAFSYSQILITALINNQVSIKPQPVLRLTVISCKKWVLSVTWQYCFHTYICFR